jgi:ribosomal protein S17
MSEATQTEKKIRQRKSRQGVVVSDRMEKTIVV